MVSRVPSVPPRASLRAEGNTSNTRVLIVAERKLAVMSKKIKNDMKSLLESEGVSG